MNTSFLLIKPSVCTEKVLELARDHFDIHGVRVEDMQLLTGQQVSRGAYVERHFSAASARAMSPSTAVAALESEESAMLFYSTFGESWDAAVEDRRVLTPEDAMIVTGTTVEGLNERWWNSKLRVRLEHGFYVSYFEEEKLYVINGHYPLLLHSLTATESQICFFILSWPEKRYTWKQFCLEVIGAADPREAVPTSFRGVLYEGWEAYGLSKQPSIADNGTIYASGPIESLAFRFIWLHRRVNEDDFGRLLLQEGLSRSFVENVVKNIPITYGEVRRSVFEMTEDMQSSEAVRLLVAVYKEDKMRMNKQNSATHGTGTPSCLADWTIVLDDEDSCEVRNRALLFVKPHANTAETRSLVEERLMQVCGMQVISQHHVSGSEVAAKCLMKQHYGTIARYAVTCTPESIQLTTETEQEFQKRFGRCWGDVLQGGRVWNADTAMRILGDISSTELYELWCSCTETMKLTPGTYVARLSRENAFLINGFFPYLQDSYEREDANVTCYVVSWLESRMTWRSFREDVVGCTNPERAHPNSLRGLIRDHWHTLGLKGPCTTTDNGVHASAGPLEAVLERHLWVNSPLTHDPFTLRLEERGLTGALLYGWRTNPVVVMGDGSRRGCVFDLLENLQTTEVVDLMCDAEQKLLAGYNEQLVNRAVVVLKPYAVSNSTITTIRDFLASSDVKVLQEVVLPSVCVKERFLENSSFLKLSSWADFTSEELLSDLVSIVKDNFSAYFELGWDDCVSRGRLMGATDICKRFSLTAAELLSQWEATEQMELHSTCWVAHLTTHNVYVLNGFVPFVRETYSKPGSVTRVFEVEWREDAWTWKDFCERLIGYTETSNPQTAAEGSLQRVFVDEWKNLGLPFRTDTPWSAALYVSQGPLEGVADRGIWLGVDIPGDHFVQRLLLGVCHYMLSPYLYDNCDLWSGGGGELEGTRSLKDDASRSTQTESMGKSLSASGYFVPQYTRHDLSYHEQSTEVVRRLKVISSRFLCGLKMNYAFLWVKPHACSKEVEAWVPRALAEHRVEVISSGCMLMHDVFRKELADRKQCALYRNAMTREAHEIPITTKQMVEFELAFGMTWGTALSLHLVVNAARAVERMGALDLLKEWDGAPRKVCLSPALYIAFIEKEGLYVVNGFYPYLRSRMYTGSHVFWYVVSWDSEVLTWEEFHRHVIGGDVPDKAEKSSLRHTLYNSWEELGLLRPPDGVDNGFCASSTPIEGISDRVAWLGIDVQQDVFGRLLLMSGIPAGYLRQMLDNPCVRHRDEPLEAAGDAFDKLCTENPLLIAQLIALHSSGGMRVVSSPAKNITAFTPATPVAHANEDVVRCNNKDAVEHLVEQAEASKSGVALPSSCVEGGVRRNYAFIMINPACTSPVVDDRVLSYITDFLRHKNIRVDGRGCVCAEDPELCHVIHTLEHGVFKYAVRQSPYQYALTSEALLSFLDAFQQVWDPRKVYNAMDASVEFNYSASYLKDRWLTCDPLVRIAPCCYVGKMPGEDIYIVNGFALHSAKTFCAAPNVKYFFLVSWDNDDGDYAHFLDSVIGDPYVKEAKHGSLQQVLCDEWEVAGLTCPPDQFEGAVLASASPLEAMLLKQMCFSLDIKRDAVCRFAMDELSVTPYIMRRCLTNPRRPCGDGRFMFDVARGMNSTDVLQLIRRENVDHLGEAPRNSAFVLLKSHSLCRGFSLTVETVFARAKIRIDEEGDISAATLRSRDFMRHLYPVEMAYAERDVESIKLTLSERERVRQVFRVSWVELLEGGVLVNAVHALKSLVGVTPIQLFYKCMAAPRKVTIRPGVVLHELHCDGIFVVNGFVPGLKVFLESTNAMQHWYVVSWSPNEMNWPTFLQEVIGDDCPKDAAVTSVRGQLYRRWRDYGITEPPDELRNGLHVSQGALQAIRQRTKCLSHSIQEDYLGSVLLRSGVHESVLHTWLENPEVTSNGIKISIFEHLGHSDTPRLLQILSALTEELRRATEKDPLAAARLPAIATESHPQEGNLGSNVTSQWRPVRENASGAAAAQPLGSPLLVESGSLLLYKNTAMVIVKPHVSDNVKVLGLLEEILYEHKIQIKRHLYKKVTPQIVEQHFSSPMLYATALVNGRLDVTPSGKESFYNTFGEEWESVVSSGRVAGACEVLSQLSITPSQLYVKWTLAQEHVQLAYDMEVTKFHAEDVYVVNAITPFECASMIQGEADACSVHCYVVSWDQRECSWKRFLDDVIGEPDPASACPTSFRGRLFAEWSAYDLPVKPNRIDNIVLASEGPLQAYKERELWCGKCDLAPDPLIRALCHVDHDLADLPEWVENPLVRYTGSRRNELNDGFYTGHLFGFVRALDTQQFIEVMTEREGVFLPLVLEQVGAGGSCNGCVDGGKQCNNAVAQADYLCESQDFLNVLADNSDNIKMLEWLKECLLEGSDDSLLLLWNHYGGRVVGEREAQKSGCVGSLLSRVVASHKDGDSDARETLCGTIDGEAFRRDVEALDFFGQPLSKGNRSRMFERMRQRGNGRMTLEEFRMALAVLRQM
uniref:Nucleoside diphosphate kinase n=1 Tax=Trypanosoma congolense (strain IL3000) TaxID=1068625 RepID=G0UWT0_TRYCI|nr:conserved hypothetical protein [Trypanosoma congolense IL3000]